ncbi:O-antigen ligase [Pontibacter sp. SGAir0037]|uniref:O-antigen ligase family protein n=1 Tax=Pontibacter sp. SGAir0037 TaxID=2571030 RepID=UPI0010CCDA8F|nr:O-antigen ligase family protein [Pontibacter sp. SGAir0037]QCR22503.1 hypothetical protein C1N53_09250 [Pontibacter sp. SGAir0037]
MRFTLSSSYSQYKVWYLLAGSIAAIVIGWSIAQVGFLVPALLVAMAISIPFVISVFNQPRLGFITLVAYCFLFFIIAREIPSFPFGIVIDLLLVTLWVAVIFNHHKFNWKNIRNDLCLLTLIWFGFNLLQIANPAGASILGWVQESRSSAFYWAFTVPLGFLLFNKKADLNLFLYLIIGLSVLGAINGLKQLHIGMTPGEQEFLLANAKTHLIWGKLRVFSFYSDAGQFGASQAHIALIAIILAFGPFATWKRVLLLMAAGILITGMFISGTRGALFALAVGIAFSLLISKNIKVFILGSAIALGGFFVLKYTHIGDSNYNIYRMRTALDPQDASLNVRLTNQKILRDYLASRPFGGGVGVLGAWGNKYNSDKFLSTIPPDSYWVKVWAMYGIVGFIIWFGIMLYILGKCCGIVWNIQDKSLKIKLLALTSGAAGILFCSYGNEVINFMPSSIVVYISWVFVYLGPKLDSKVSPSELPESYA